MSKKLFARAVAFSFSFCLLSCATPTQLSKEANQVRFMTKLDEPNCEFISQVETWGDWFKQEFGSIDGVVDDGFNVALNAVASVGGDAYRIVGTARHKGYLMEAWRCGWGNSQRPAFVSSATPPRQIFSAERQECRFIKTVTEGSNWGFTKKRNLENAKNDAIGLVQEAGGDAYYVVKETLGSIVVVIVEAWRCNFEGAN